VRSPLASTATMAAVEVCLVDRGAPAHQLQTGSLLSTSRVGAPGLRHCARRHVASVISITLPPDHKTSVRDRHPRPRRGSGRLRRPGDPTPARGIRGHRGILRNRVCALGRGASPCRSRATPRLSKSRR
jgi:hypothetical protein